MALLLGGFDFYEVWSSRAENRLYKDIPASPSQMGNAFANGDLLSHVVISLCPDEIVCRGPVLSRGLDGHLNLGRLWYAWIGSGMGMSLQL